MKHSGMPIGSWEMPIDTSVVSIGTDFKLGLNMFGLGQDPSDSIF